MQNGTFCAIVIGAAMLSGWAGTPAQGPYVIKDDAFVDRSTSGACSTDVGLEMTAGQLQARAIPERNVSGMAEIRGGRFVIFCVGAKHTLIGRVTLHGYVFDSDSKDPLRFVVGSDNGYVYVAGKGTVTSPDGRVQSLPPPAAPKQETGKAASSPKPGQPPPVSGEPRQFGTSFVELQNDPHAPGAYILRGYWRERNGRPAIFSPGAVLIIAEKNGLELGGTRYDFRSVVVVEGTEQKPVFRVARSTDKIVLGSTVTVFGQPYAAGPFAVPATGRLASATPGPQAGLAQPATGTVQGRMFTDATGKRIRIPDWFPLYPGVAIQDLQKDPAGGEKAFLFTARDPVDKVFAFYEEHLDKAGLKVRGTKTTLSRETVMANIDAADADKFRSAALMIVSMKTGSTVKAAVWEHPGGVAEKKEPLAALAVDATGKWTYEMAGRPRGPARQVTVTLKADGVKLTGSVRFGSAGSGGGGATPPPDLPISNGKVEGNNVYFEVTRDFAGNTMTIKYEGTLNRDELKLKIARTFQGVDPVVTEATARREN